MPLDPYFRISGPSTLGQTDYFGTAAPSTAAEKGPYAVGDKVWNTQPAAAGFIGWVCTTAGATGATSVWKGFGAIAA